MTYGDGVTDLDIREVIEFHRDTEDPGHSTAMQPPGRYGVFTLAQGPEADSSFAEKPIGDGAWVNGGFFVLEPQILDYIDGDLVWEQEPMELSPGSNNCSPSDMPDSGYRWTVFVTRSCWRKCGHEMLPRGKFGTTRKH